MLGGGYSVSILLEVLLFPPSRQGAYQRAGYKPVPRSVLRVLKVVNAARALKRSETNMAQMSCRDQLPIHAWPGCTHSSFRAIRQRAEPGGVGRQGQTNPAARVGRAGVRAPAD